MANKDIFRSLLGRKAPAGDAVNEAGGRAYRFSAKHALAQYAATSSKSSRSSPGASRSNRRLSPRRRSSLDRRDR
jgi:hypothetical protein